MARFEIVLVNEKVKFYDRIALFFYIVDTIGTGAMLFYGHHAIKNNTLVMVLGICLGLLLVYPVLSLLYQKRDKYFIALMTSSSLLVAYWVMLGYWYIGAATLFFLWLYIVAKRELKVYVFREKIQYPSYPARTFQWEDLNNLVLKDRLLTIDFKNNKIIQQLIDEGKVEVDEKEFNEFCRKQLDLK
jgi:hypothetical protein